MSLLCLIKICFLVQIDVGNGNFWQIHLGRQGVWSPEDFMDDTSAGGRLLTTKAENDFTGNVKFGLFRNSIQAFGKCQGKVH